MLKHQNRSIPREGAEATDMDDFFDDESSPLTAQDEYGERLSADTKGWDVFRNPPLRRDSGSMADQKCVAVTLKILKLLVYIIVFAIVLSCGVIAKGTALLMTSQLQLDRTVLYCNRLLGAEKTFVALLPEEERVSWIWCILIGFAVPEIGTLIRSVRICVFKSSRKPKVSHFVFVFLMETLHVIGLAILFMSVLPDLDVIQGAMLMNCVCFVPALLGLLSRNEKVDGTRKLPYILADVVAVVAQMTSFIVWPIQKTSNPSLWLTPVSLILVSCRWWGNYVTIHSPVDIINSLGRIEEELKYTRYFTYIFVSVWKIIAFFAFSILILHFKGNTISHIFTMAGSTFSNHNITVTEVQSTIGGGTIPQLSEVVQNGTSAVITMTFTTPIYILLIQMLAAYFIYIFGKFACKIMIQEFSFALPISLTIPTSISLLTAACSLRNRDPCYFHGMLPDHLFFDSPTFYFLTDFILEEHAWVWVLWLLSYTWVTIQIWTPKCERLASTEKLFVTPMYDTLLVDQAMALNRRRDDQPEISAKNGTGRIKTKDKKKDDSDSDYTPYEQTNNSALGTSVTYTSDLVTRVYVCATMWHENKDEMIDFLKSILRLDEDQCARRNAQNFLNVVDPDYYELETHIFFDDAFEVSDHDVNDSQVNRFVRLLVNVLDEAASDVHQTRVHVSAPKKYPTPYGGRLIWTLPGKTTMIAHLKDKSKIRHRKRWSQVMYMYYLLGHRLMQMPISIDRKEIIAENTYLLTLDGDIDFQPNAVKLLIDLMKRNKNLGAACGRIHPVGSGPMVWYQMFEYAIGHWLQKATEHTIGCVLCSPGCFSLFRGKALMDDRVMSKYTTRSTEARHYVQYDQGEDRWLCTLLLQRGYRVEYSAASDAYTHAPEGFNEFYNQRRRWVPSTMANIMDLIMNSKRTIKNNDNISLVYMSYQILLMVGTILGPGTIFLMLVGACVAAFQIDNWTSFFWNLIPIVIFMIICFTCKSHVQLFIAGFISIGYGLVMMAVIVGVLIQIADDGWAAPSSLFLFLVVGQLIIAGLLHPQELLCLPCGIIYYVTIPSMYLLLVIYSITNLNNVTWGTREVQVKKTIGEWDDEKVEAEKTAWQRKNKPLLDILRDSEGTDKNDQGSIDFSCAGLFRCMFCTHDKPFDKKQELITIAESLEKVQMQLMKIERVVEPQPHLPGRKFTMAYADMMEPIEENSIEADQLDSESDTLSQDLEVHRERTFLVSPYWLEDESLQKGEVDFLSTQEEQFWKEILDEYLFPIDEDQAEKERIATDLKELRNKCVFAFFMLNALFVLIIFLMQLNKESLHIKWPFGAKTNITYDETALEVHVTTESLQLEPIGIVFVCSFALVLVIQFIAMFFHRFGTLAHILASTTLDWYCCKKAENVSVETLQINDAVEIVKDLQRLDVMDREYEEITSKEPGRRKTVRNLESGKRKSRVMNNLDDAFRQRFFSIAEDLRLPSEMATRRSIQAVKAFEMRRNTILAERKQSKLQAQAGGSSIYGMFGKPTSMRLRPVSNPDNSDDEEVDRSPGVINLGFDHEDSPRV
ncbi:chitin synthase chs-2-like [Neodiprion lecontei]|uniref:chitin synthase n=1 Tax=Neodiprion lecontei TaxID=441921 RepID=A0A6J0BSA4_NEOLC|nr:chitin synthase chs-2-like [Neodiprion lecontei]